MALMPGAVQKLIPSHNKRRTCLHNRVNLHVAVSEADSLYGYFRLAGVCSTFYVRRDGTKEQYIDTDYYSAADLDGNDATISIETQGGVHDAQNEPWTPEQIAAIVEIVVWANTVHQIPIVAAVDSRKGATSKGVSYHRLGIDPWRVTGGMRYSRSKGKICPGDAKIAQIPRIVAIAAGTVLPPPITILVSSKTWLQRGDRSSAVRELQRALNEVMGTGLAVDGSFGPETERVVRAYQTTRDLVVDGFAGPQTLAALAEHRGAVYVPADGPVLRRGSHGPEVNKMQRALRSRYPAYAGKLVADGSFGPATEAVVREFQRRAGLEVDGVCGPRTRAALGL